MPDLNPTSVETYPEPDLPRLSKALAFEADRGFQDVQGKHERFSQFLRGSLAQEPPAHWPLDRHERHKWQDLAQRYQQYPDLHLEDRQHLVAETRRWLHQIRQQLEPPPPPKPAYIPKPGPDLSLDKPLQYLKGIGEKSSDKLAQLGLLTVRDALYYFPRDYINFSEKVRIRDLKEGETITLVGTVRSVSCFTSPKNKKLTIFNLKLADESGIIHLSRFYAGRQSNRGWQDSLLRQYPRGALVAASGLVKKSKMGLTLNDPEFEVLGSQDDDIRSLKIGKIQPKYALTEGVPADLVRKATWEARPAAALLKDPIPVKLLQTLELMDLPQAVQQVHFPDSAEQMQAARRRLVFDEFFYLQLGLLLRRKKYQEQAKTLPRYQPLKGELVDQFYTILPFQLTQAQQHVVAEILQDLAQPIPMNRLVQGDVGSGKTVVAVIALLAAIQGGWQTALMAPTEVLTEQHYRKLVGWFGQLGLPVELLTGSTPAAKRREILRQLQTGELPLIVGTHALIQPTVEFNQLGLVIIDEQHRFGVEQRAALQRKGDHPDVLNMTATPIPRTLTLTLHGDLDVSQITELPPGRKPIQTLVSRPADRAHIYDLVRREIVQGRQIYVVLPLIEESEKNDLKSAIEEHQRLQDKIFPQFRVGLLHGRMSSADKDSVITAFRDHELDLLVSTTVVEVGVDVPNASVMIIEHAERFGLSQLHQLRGRVGRGAAQSFCILLSSSKTETAMQRLKVLEQSQDGFFIAEMDLRFRGPGEVMGTRQSGLPDFALASLMEDQDVLELSRAAAEKILASDPDQTKFPELWAVATAKQLRA